MMHEFEQLAGLNFKTQVFPALHLFDGTFKSPLLCSFKDFLSKLTVHNRKY